MTDLINKTIEELIEFCKEKGINYLTKANKPMAKKTIISNLKKTGLIEDDEDDDLDTETIDINIIIRKTHNYLYKSAGIVGSKAQNDIMRVLIMRIFNILLSKNNSYLLSVLEDTNINDKCVLKQSQIEVYKSYIYDISNLLKEADIKNVWNNFITKFMSRLFDNIYVPEDALFNTPNDYDIIRLIKIISKFKITDEFIDEFFMKNGDIHESFLKYQGNVNSKELGQFFTPKIVIKSLLNECGFKELILNKEGTDFSLCDPCMGTGGLLCYTYNYCKDKINPSKIYGCDIERDTIKFGSASLMLSTNQYNSNIIRCNSLIENPYLFNRDEDKFDIIFINPPFGTKNNYKSLNKLFDNYKNKITTTKDFNGNPEIEFKDVYPIISNTGTELFIQMIIFLLKKDGIACIILPDGELMTSIGSYNIRKYILDNCQVMKIININGGTFTNTGIKTKALIIRKGDYDNYNQDIEFIELNQEVKVLGIRKLNEKLQFTFEDEKEEIINYNEDIEIKTLGEVCEFQNGYSFKSTDYEKYNNTNIGIVQIKSIQNGFIDTEKITEYIKEDKKYKSFEIQEGDILIALSGATIGKIGIYNLQQKSYLNQRVAKINAKNGINQKYIYYWYISNKINEKILNISSGVAQPNISTNDISLIEIPIPSIEIQNKIIEYLDMIYENIKNNNGKIETIKKLNKNYLELNLKFNKEIEIKTLGEISEFIKTGKNKPFDSKTGSLYPYYGTSKITGYTDEYLYDGNYLLTARNGAIGNCFLVNGKFFPSDHIFIIDIKNKILLKFIYYYITNNSHKLDILKTGLCIPNITKQILENLKIPIPSIEKQKEIIEYLDFNDELIKTLEKENEINKNNAKLLMKQILYK
jgi:type I restriction enzyme S subunit